MEYTHQKLQTYLENNGVYDAINRALFKLSTEPNKPDNAIHYIWENICEDCPNKKALDDLRTKYQYTLEKIEKLEEELYWHQGNFKLSDEDMHSKIQKGFISLIEDETCQSLLKKYLTKELLFELLPLKTRNDTTLWDNIRCGLNYHTFIVGFYAADAESYDLFYSLFDPIILDYYGLLAVNYNTSVTSESSDTSTLSDSLSISDNDSVKFQNLPNWGDPNEIDNLDTEQMYITSTKIITSRNFKEYPFTPKISENDLMEIEEMVIKIIESLQDDIDGKYISIKNINREKYMEMIKSGIAFKKDNKYLDFTGNYRFWPHGRGIFYTISNDLIIWVNSEDHLKIISQNENGNLGEVYERLVKFSEIFERSFQFAYRYRYGYLTLSPENLGTNLHISMRVKLPNFSKNQNKLKEFLQKFNLHIVHNLDNDENMKDIIEISMKNRIGPSQFEFIKEFENSISKLIEAEKEFMEEKTKPNNTFDMNYCISD